MTVTSILDKLSDIIGDAIVTPGCTKITEELETLWGEIDKARYNGGIENW